MIEEQQPVRDFFRKWIFHILVAVAGGVAFFADRKYDGYLAALIFLITLAWIVRNMFHPDEDE
jgi:apolipoprotein N-acyltransferase